MFLAQCRCDNCHTQYTMRADDEQETILSTPRCMLKDEYREPIKKAWEKYQISISEMTDDMIDEFMIVEGKNGDKD